MWNGFVKVTILVFPARPVFGFSLGAEMWNGFVKVTILVFLARPVFGFSLGAEGVNVERPQRSEDERR